MLSQHLLILPVLLPAALAALPALWMLMRLRPTVQALEIAPGTAAADD
jgi:PAT family beta-lactamase induction signal transducer AmpG